MVIRFAKHLEKAPTLTCIRDDGSLTWFRVDANGEFFVAHDLLHYAVETILGFSTAFYGMVAAGRDLNDFGTQGGEIDPRPYSEEAMQAEQIVGLVQVLFPPGAKPDHSTFAEAIGAKAGKLPGTQGITESDLARIHAKWSDLLEQWQNLPNHAILELNFP